MAEQRESWRPWRRKSPPAPIATWRFRVERERSAVGRLNDALEQKLLPGVPEMAVRALQVALDELLTNVIMHAEQAAGAIEIEIAYPAGAIETKLRYISAEFDPTRWRPAEQSGTIAASSVGGLGLQLVRSLMDDFQHQYEDGSNVVTLRKRC